MPETYQFFKTFVDALQTAAAPYDSPHEKASSLGPIILVYLLTVFAWNSYLTQLMQKSAA
jgi:hypothetical protein